MPEKSESLDAMLCADGGPDEPVPAPGGPQAASTMTVASKTTLATWLVDLAEHDRRHPEVAHRWVSADGLLGHLERVLQRGCALEPQPMHDVAIRADEDDVTGVVHCVGCPNPRVVRVNAVVGVRLPIQLAEPRVF